MLQSGQRADQVAAAVEDRQPGPHLAALVPARGEQLVQREPACHALVAAAVEIQPAVRKQLYRAFAGLLPAVPQVGRGKAAVDALARQLAGQNGRCRFRDNQIGLI